MSVLDDTRLGFDYLLHSTISESSWFADTVPSHSLSESYTSYISTLSCCDTDIVYSGGDDLLPVLITNVRVIIINTATNMSIANAVSFLICISLV